MTPRRSARSLHQQAQTEAEQIIARAKQEISLTKQAALQELQGVAADLSVEVAGKILRRDLSASDQQRLVEESLAQLVQSGSSNGDGTRVSSECRVVSPE